MDNFDQFRPDKTPTRARAQLAARTTRDSLTPVIVEFPTLDEPNMFEAESPAEAIELIQLIAPEDDPAATSNPTANQDRTGPNPTADQDRTGTPPSRR